MNDDSYPSFGIVPTDPETLNPNLSYPSIPSNTVTVARTLIALLTYSAFHSLRMRHNRLMGPQLSVDYHYCTTYRNLTWYRSATQPNPAVLYALSDSQRHCYADGCERADPTGRAFAAAVLADTYVAS